MIAKDVRILDWDGKPTHKGRVDVRNEGVWGTICASGLNDSAAKIICEHTGYKDGKFLNPNENKGRGFCASYEGSNYCGVEPAPIFFSHLNCQGNEENILDCSRKTADRSFCSHEYDAIIECSNTDTEEYVSFDANTVRIVDANRNPAISNTGRLEIFKGTWGTICNSKFTDQAAQVVCKQMGYHDGRLFGQPDSNSVCANVYGNNLCGEYGQPIKLTEVICKGHETGIKQCKSSDNTASCSHFNDVVIKCEGFGDPSGNSQNIKKPKILNPVIEKLPMAPTYNARCESTAKNIYFRGNPGSIFLVNCPSECASQNYSITGTGVYTFDSSICIAALQSGVITNEGGNLVLIKTYGQDKYYGSTIRRISSLESTYSKTSFFVAVTNSAYNNMVAMYNNGSFLEIESNEKLISNNLSILNKNTIRFSSFIEIDSVSGAEIKAVYEWIPPNNDYSFDGLSIYSDLSTNEAAKRILDLRTFSIYAKLKMSGSKGKPQTIISVGGCEGFSITIDANGELIFDVKCGNLTEKSGLFIPVNYDSHIGVVYDGSKIMYFLDGIKYNELSAYFSLQSKPKITIGRSSEYSADFFYGKIFSLAFFSEALGPKRMYRIYKNGYTQPDKILAPKYITLDNRICISSCANQPIPGVAGSPIPPREAITYEINGDKTLISGAITGADPNLSSKSDLNPFIEVKCSSTAREIFKGDIKINDKIRINCPVDCNKIKSVIYGTYIYSFDSPACIAAIHAGVLKTGESGKLLIRALPGFPFYQGTMQYEIQSTSIDKSDYSFSVEQAPPVIQIDCKETASIPQFAGTLGMKFLVRCPENCSKIPHNVFGNNLYSGDSSICQSAIHAGALNDRGGEVQFMIEPGQKLYFGIRAFGIDSKERDSYVKSIKFFGTNNNLFQKFKEDNKNKFVSQNWDINDNLDANGYPSKWEYVRTPPIIKASTEFLLHQSKRIKSKIPFSYGSLLTLKDVDVVNSLYKISFFFVNLEPVGVIFRYKDENNYYHLRLNNMGPYKIVLFKKFEGKSTTLATSNLSISPRIWYTFTLLIYYDKIQIFLQLGDLRNNQLIFDAIDNDIQRGSLGIGTDGNDDFYINGIFIDNYDMKKSHMSTKAGTDIRSFENILLENTQTHRNKYCKSLYGKNENAAKQCNEFHNYCKLRCDEFIHKRENILNFSCCRACLKDSLLKDKIDNMQRTDEVSYGLNSGIWTPKEKEKCDFKPDDPDSVSYWVPCEIVEAKANLNDPEQKFVKIKYTINTKTKISTVLYPNITLKKCGDMLKSRTDCA